MELIRNSYGVFYPDKPITSVTWPFFDLLVVHHGSIEVLAAGKRHELISNSCLLIFPDTMFSIVTQSKECTASVHHFKLQDSLYSQPFAHLNKWKEKVNCAVFCSFGGYQQLITDIKRLLQSDPQVLEQGCREHIQTNLLNIILLQLNQNTLMLSNGYSKHQESINKLILQAKMHPGFFLTIEQMASEVALSSSHFRMVFQRHYNETPLRYFQNLKMNHACRLLAETLYPIKQISLDLGYDEISNFYRHFKDWTGVTPLTFRKKQGRGEKFF